MKLPRFALYPLLTVSALAADGPAASSAPAEVPAPPAAKATEPTWNIPTPLKPGQVIDLFPEGVPGAKDIGPEQVNGNTYTNISNPRLICYPPPEGTPSNGAAIIFCAGGGYQHVAIGGGMQQALNPLGVTVFNLIYRCREFGAPAPQQDVLRAVRLVRSHAKEFGIDPDKIGVMGGSAGGHVAASAGTLYDDAIGKTGIEFDKISARPNFMILIFSVLTMEPPYAHADSKRNLLGSNPTQEMIDQYSLEKHVTANTPPTFLIHTQQDTTVREENDLLFYAALRKANVPSELHLYALGPHGSGTAPNLGTTAIWPKLAEEWLRANGWIPYASTSLLRGGYPGASGAPGARSARGGRGNAAQPAASAESAAPAASAASSPAAPPAAN